MTNIVLWMLLHRFLNLNACQQLCLTYKLLHYNNLKDRSGLE